MLSRFAFGATNCAVMLKIFLESAKMLLKPKNWAEFQHYKNRRPPWIKLHRWILDDFDYQGLPVASKALAPMLWLLASDQEDGQIDATTERLAFRFRLTPKEVDAALKPLIDKGFFIMEQGASVVLAESKQVALLEEKSRGETEKRRSATAFEEFWSLYPKKKAKEDAQKAFSKVSGDEFGQLMTRLRIQVASDDWRRDGGQFIPYPASWLNGKRWQDEEIVTLAAEPDRGPDPALEKIERDRILAAPMPATVRQRLAELRNQ